MSMRLLYILLGSALLTLGSCCTKVMCDLVIQSVSFSGFSASELDTVRVIVLYEDSQTPPDTIVTEAIFYQGDDYASLVRSLPVAKNGSYSYYLPATGQTYLVNGIEYSRQSCNTCFPTTPESDYYDLMQAYHVNGVRYEGNTFMIRK